MPKRLAISYKMEVSGATTCLTFFYLLGFRSVFSDVKNGLPPNSVAIRRSLLRIMTVKVDKGGKWEHGSFLQKICLDVINSVLEDNQPIAFLRTGGSVPQWIVSNVDDSILSETVPGGALSQKFCLSDRRHQRYWHRNRSDCLGIDSQHTETRPDDLPLMLPRHQLER